MSNVLKLLQAVERGEPQASEQLLPLVYDELRKLAQAKLRNEKPGQTLQATALVHEAYLRLAGGGERGDAGAKWDGRGHFLAAAAEAMRRILVESARRKQSLKRGGDLVREAIDDELLIAPEANLDVVALDDALTKLAGKDHRKADLVKLRYFAGLTIKQAAKALNISSTTAERDWNYARAWLCREMSKDEC